MSFTIFSIKKNVFLGYKIKNFKKSKNWYFSKGVNPLFWSKNGHFSILFFNHYRPRKYHLGYSKKKKKAFQALRIHKSSDMCFPTKETHIPSDMWSPNWETRILSDMCCSTWETHIRSDMCSFTWESRIPSDMCSPTWETHIPSDMCVSHLGNTYF